MTTIIEVVQTTVVDSPETQILVIAEGIAGPRGLDGAPGDLVFTGIYDNGTTYVMNEAVQYNGSTYILKDSSAVGVPPTTGLGDDPKWTLVASKGADGTNGTNGADGAPGADGADGISGDYNALINVPSEFPPSAHTHSYEPANANIQAHISSTANPHTVTAAQVGAYSTSQVDTALSGKSDTSHNHAGTYEPANANLQAHVASTANPHTVTASQVGAYSTAQSDLALAGKTNMFGFPVDASGNYLCTLTYNESTRTITLTPTSGNYDIYVGGTKYTKGVETKVHGTTQGGHFIYFDETGTLVTSTTAWDLLRHAPVAYVFWDSTNSRGIAFEERHHAGRDVWWHRNQHFAEGTKATSGFGISGYTLNDGSSDGVVTFSVATGRLEDEDIQVDTEVLPDGGPYTI